MHTVSNLILFDFFIDIEKKQCEDWLAKDLQLNQ